MKAVACGQGVYLAVAVRIDLPDRLFLSATISLALLEECNPDPSDIVGLPLRPLVIQRTRRLFHPRLEL